MSAPFPLLPRLSYRIRGVRRLAPVKIRPCGGWVVGENFILRETGQFLILANPYEGGDLQIFLSKIAFSEASFVNMPVLGEG